MTERITNLETLPLIFDRRRATHPWIEPFRELESTDLNRALCQPTHPELGASRAGYLEAPNGGNAISRATIPAHEQLVHVASLNRILWRLTTAELPTPDLEFQFPDLTGRSLPERTPGSDGRERGVFSGQVGAIADEVNRRGLDHVQRLAGLLCESLGDRQPPWWAGFAHELMPAIDRGDWTGVCQALGLGHLEAGEWLIVWRYEAGEVYLQYPNVPFYRPTVVEAGDNPFHFPSPPGHLYGITMPLAAGQRGAYREVLHPPLTGDMATEACRYPLVRIPNTPIDDHSRISELRREHRRRLARNHPQPERTGWLERHPPPP